MSAVDRGQATAAVWAKALGVRVTDYGSIRAIAPRDGELPPKSLHGDLSPEPRAGKTRRGIARTPTKGPDA